MSWRATALSPRTYRGVSHSTAGRPRCAPPDAVAVPRRRRGLTPVREGGDAPRPCATASPSSASARRSTGRGVGSRTAASSSSPARRSSPPRRTPASRRTTSTASLPTPTTATTHPGWRRRSAARSCTSRAWCGTAAGAACAPPWRTRRTPSTPAPRARSSSCARSARGSSAASAASGGGPRDGRPRRRACRRGSPTRSPWASSRPRRCAPSSCAATEGGEGAWGASLYTHAAPAPPYPAANLAPVARRLWAMAGCGPADIDVAQIYENFTGMVLLALEDLGFCARGEGGPFVEDGKLAGPAGALPLNTAGGNLAEAYVHGLNLVLEGVRQMRGESTCQVRDAELCLVAGGPGVAPTSALVLRRG